MGFNFKTVAAVLLFAIFAGMLASAQTDVHNTVGITILVYNDGKLPPSQLSAAERQASFIFRRAGVVVEWLTCLDASGEAAACRHLSPGAQFVLSIVHEERVSNDIVFGAAFLSNDGGKYCDIFMDRIERLHHETGVEISDLLGAVMAHEIGHLLLGSHSHSPFGIMTARWQKETLDCVSMGWLFFNSDQASRMRRRIQNLQARQIPVQYARTRPIE